MKTSRIMAIVFGATISLGACADKQPTAPVAEAPDFKKNRDKAAERTALLTNVPVDGLLFDGATAAGSFAGSFTAKRFDIDPVTRELSLTGVLNGAATLVDGSVVPVVNQAFTTAVVMGKGGTASAGIASPASAGSCQSGSASATTSQVIFQQVQLGSCDVLFLDLGPLHLDLLGLTVDLSRVILDVNAVTGPGNLLGNLLCALLGLLDITALLTTITQLLETINNILAGLNPGGATGASFGFPVSAATAEMQSA